MLTEVNTVICDGSVFEFQCDFLVEKSINKFSKGWHVAFASAVTGRLPQ